MSSKRIGIFLTAWEQMTENVCVSGPHKVPVLSFITKSYFSVHLQAIVDAKYKSMTVDIGAYGRQSDSGVFTESNVFRHLEAGSFNSPPPRQIPRTNVTSTCVLVGDQGYPLREYLRRPYPTDNGRVSRQKEIFNYRLSRARRTVECAFGIQVAKWRCLKTE